jgi:hypothetical protein
MRRPVAAVGEANDDGGFYMEEVDVMNSIMRNMHFAEPIQY